MFGLLLRFLKHRFTRMESNLIALAKTVAQISVELKSIRSVEDVIRNLTKDVQELQKLNLGGLDSNSSVTKGTGDLFRSSSEPRQLNSNLQCRSDSYELNQIKEINSRNGNQINNQNENNLELSKRKLSKETVRVPTYTNPRKLKKLTKYDK